LQITGDLSKDRRVIHRLADGMHQAFFGQDGGATSRILFTLRTKDPNRPGNFLSSVWEADYDGANARQVTKSSGYCVTPVFIPPKSGNSSGSFLYVGYKSGQPKIFVGTFDGREGDRLVSLGGNQLMPAISRQRDKIAFISDVTANPDLFLVPFDPQMGVTDKPRKIFAAPMATQGTPTFSPDGNKIAFVSNKEGAPRIWVMEIPAPGTPLKAINPKLLSKLQRECTAPSWSPDGKKIAYCSSTAGVRQIWIYDFITGQDVQITRGEKNKENPSWSSNSLCLIYNTSDAKDSDLYIVGIKAKRPEKIAITVLGEKHFPAWETR
jgi:TolB protein